MNFNSYKKQRKLVGCGILLGVYLNIFHALPFIEASDFMWVFVLIFYIAIVLPVFAHLWDSNKLKSDVKARLLFFGLTLASIVSALIYLGEAFLGNHVFNILANPAHFAISQIPVTSFIVSLSIAGLFASATIFLEKRCCCQ